MDPTAVSDIAILPFILRKSTGRYPNITVLERELSNLYGASLSCDVGKYGDLRMLTFTIMFIDDQITIDKEIISDKCADLLADMVLNPNLVDGIWNEDDFQLERQNLIDTIESEINNKRGYALKKCTELMLTGTGFEISKYGTVEGAKSITQQSAVAQYHHLIKTAKIDIGFIGFGDSQIAMDKFKDIFGKIERDYKPFTSEKPAIPNREVQTKTETMDISQGKLVLGFKTPPMNDLAQTRIGSVATALYGAIPTSKLFVNVREKLSLCYYCAASPNRAANIMMVDIGVEHQNKEKAQDEILAQLELMKKGEITDSELSETKLAMMNSYRSIEDSISSMDSWYFTRRLLGDQTTPANEIEAISKITKEEVIQFMQGVTLDSVFFLTSK